MLDRIGGALLIFQRIAPDIVFAPRILNLGTSDGAGFRDAYQGKNQRNKKQKTTSQTHNECKGTKRRVNKWYV